jgi:hypothetical protein
VALGRIAVAEGDPVRARACLREAATFDPEVLRAAAENAAAVAEAAAALALLDGEPRRAAGLLGAAEALRGDRATGPDAAAARRDARTALGAADCAAAVAETAALDRAAAVDLLTGYVTG